MGMLGASIGMGFVIGPAIGAGMSHWGFSYAAFVAAGISGLNLILGHTYFPAKTNRYRSFRFEKSS